MFNKQLRTNIKRLDLQIGELSNEIEELKKTSKYEIKMDKLKVLTELRKDLVNGLSDNHVSYAVIELDRQINDLVVELEKMEDDDVYLTKKQQLDDLTKIRCQLTESKVKESKIAIFGPPVISAVTSGILTLAVLKHEKTDIITSKAFNMVTKPFRG